MTEPRPEPARPTAPDPKLLAEVARAAGGIVGWPSGTEVEWEVGERVDRRRSSLFLIRAVDPPGTPVDAYYKVLHLPIRDPARLHRWEKEAAEGLSRTRMLDQELARLVAGHPITFSQTLVVEPSSLTHVTLGVEGEAFGKAWRHTVTRARRQRILENLRLIGRAAALIEQCSPEPVEVDDSDVQRSIDKRLTRMRRALAEPTLTALARRMEELDPVTLNKPGGLIYVHGDFSSSNVLIRQGGIGLIDFSWTPELRGYDVARFAFRVEYDTVTSHSWADASVSALLEGYGDPDLRQSPNWLALRVPWLLKIVELGRETRFDRYSVRARRAMKEIESIL